MRKPFCEAIGNFGGHSVLTGGGQLRTRGETDPLVTFIKSTQILNVS